jgi:hypothetical protein
MTDVRAVGSREHRVDEQRAQSGRRQERRGIRSTRSADTSPMRISVVSCAATPREEQRPAAVDPDLLDRWIAEKRLQRIESRKLQHSASMNASSSLASILPIAQQGALRLVQCRRSGAP